MDDPFRFSEVVRKYVERSAYSYASLAERAGLPNKTTISNWVNSIVKRPREWRDLVSLAAALNLNEFEATELLESAEYPSIEELLLSADNERDRQLLSLWADAVQARLVTDAPFQVPTPDVIEFIGRAKEQEQIEYALLHGDKICVIDGMAGVGKSTLTVHIAHHLRRYFPDGVLWARIPDPDLGGEASNVDKLMPILGSFAEAYERDISHYADIESRSRMVRQVLANKQALVVLDNVNSSQELDVLLPATETCSVLVTTRNHKIVIGRKATVIKLEPFNTEDSLFLLASIVSSNRVTEEQDGARQIVSFVGGLALALRVIGSTLVETEYLTIAEFAELLAHEESRLAHLDDWQDATKSVRASFELSYRRLAPPMQQLFALLSIFNSSDFAIEAIAAIAEISLVETKLFMGRLTSLSLVEANKPSDTARRKPINQDRPELIGEGRYRLHPLLRAFAREKLGNIAPTLAKRHLDYYLAFVQSNAQKSPAAWDKLEKDLPHLLLAIERAAGMKDSLALVAFEKALIHDGEFLNLRGYYREAIQLLSHSLATQELSNEKRHQPRTLNKLAYFSRRLGQYEDAQRYAEAAGKLAAVLGDQEQQADSWRYLAMILHSLGELEQALRYFEKELEVRYELNDPDRLAGSLVNLGMALIAPGHYANAGQYMNKALAIYQARNDRPNISIAIAIRGIALLYLGDYARALHDFKAALEVSQEINDLEGIAQNLLNISIVQNYLGEYSHALAFLQQALPHWQDLGDSSGEALTLITMAEVYASLSDHPQAAEYLEMAKAHLYGRADSQVTEEVELEYLNIVGSAHYQFGDYVEALEAYQRLCIAAEEAGVKYFLTQGKLGLAQTYIALGTELYVKKALRYAEEAVVICQELQLAGDQPRAYTYLCKANLLLGDTETALQNARWAISLLNVQKHVRGSEIEIYLYTSEALAANGQEVEQRQLLKAAYEHIQATAAKIEDETLRARFLSTPVNREIFSTWEQFNIPGNG